MSAPKSPQKAPAVEIPPPPKGLGPKIAFQAKSGTAFATKFSESAEAHDLLNAAFAEWAAKAAQDPSMHFKIAGVKDFVAVLLSMGDVAAPTARRISDHLEQQD